MESLLKKVSITLSRHGMLESGDCVVIAVSGGADSVCLLDVLNRLVPELGLRLIVAHYDHGLRKADDERETRFVKELARRINLLCEVGRASGLSKEFGSLEERAREFRYRFLEEIREKHGAQKIALGHTLDDQAETVIMRFLRGSGSTGLSGIPPTRDQGIIRPLIDIRRKEVEEYLMSRGLTWQMDSSNQDTGYLRNRIRLELLPELIQYQPQLVEQLGDLAKTLREENRFLDALAREWFETHFNDLGDGSISIPRVETLRIDPAIRGRVIRRAIERVAGGLRRIERRHVEAIEELARGERPQGEINLPKGLTVKRSYDRLVCGFMSQEEKAHFTLEIPSEGTYGIKEAGIRITIKQKNPNSLIRLDGSPLTVFLDAGKVKFPLTLRSILPGDRFVPLGMQGHRKIKDFLIDLKIPSEERPGIPLLLSGDTIAWVCGYRMDDRFKLEEGTEKVLEVTLKNER
jgi:tRNA(Ile)-lysidine synthase